MANKNANDKKGNNSIETESTETFGFDADYDFMADVITEYGEIDNIQELNLIVKKIENETKREFAKIGRTKKIVAKRNKAKIKKGKLKKSAEKNAYNMLSPQKKAIYKQRKLEQKENEKEAIMAEKIASVEQKAEQYDKVREKKAQDAEYKMHERIAMLAMTPAEKNEYLFQKKAKSRILRAQERKASAISKQKEIAASNILPVVGFIRFLFISMAVTAILAYCGTNIYLDMGYYSEKIDELRSGIEEYDIKLDGDMVVGVGDLESGLSVYNQILDNSPIMEEQLGKLNQTYFWVFNRETVASLGINNIKDDAGELRKVIDSIQIVVQENTNYTSELIDAYNSDLALLDLKDSLLTYETKIDKIASDFDAISLPNGLGEHKEAFNKKIGLNKDYYNIMVGYVDELIAIRETLSDANEVVASAESIKPKSSDLDGMVDEYVKKLGDVVNSDKKISTVNNNTAYASIIGKKDIEYVGNAIMSDEAISFYLNIVELKSIIDLSNKVQRKCIDLPYPVVKKTKDEVIQSYISQNTTEKAIEDNAKLIERIASIVVPDRIESKTRKYKTGLEIRAEFLEQQKQYIDLEEEKNDVFVDYDNAEAAYNTAKAFSRLERKENGRTDKYYEYYEQVKEADKAMDAAEIAAQDGANDIQERMKPIRVKAMDLKKEYEGYMDYD